MKELKCNSCGGILTIDEDKEYGVCPYCKSKYKLNDDKTIKFKMDDNTKETINNGYKLFGKISLAVIIPVVIGFLLVFSLIIYGVFSFNKKSEENYNEFKDTYNKITENMTIDNDIKEHFDDIKINSFNSKYETYAGRTTGLTVTHVLDSVIANNKKNTDKLINVVYEDINTTEANEIIKLKDRFDTYSNYEIILDYDKNKLVNKITIENR